MALPANFSYTNGKSADSEILVKMHTELEVEQYQLFD
jgi:hypothetical protein